MKILATVILLPLVLSSRPVFGQVTGARADTAAQPDGLKSWLPSKLVPGAFYMPLVGEGAKSGAYVYRFKAPPGTRIPAHWHTQTMHQTVLSGTLLTVMGESLDSAACSGLALVGSSSRQPTCGTSNGLRARRLSMSRRKFQLKHSS